MIDNSAVLARYLINDFVNAGMTYSRISRRLNLSPSTIQKIAKKLRTPRDKTLQELGDLYSKIFTSPQLYGSAVESYFMKNELSIKATLALTKQLLQHEVSQV